MKLYELLSTTMFCIYNTSKKSIELTEAYRPNLFYVTEVLLLFLYDGTCVSKLLSFDFSFMLTRLGPDRFQCGHTGPRHE
jgi:hypothetical protein